MSLFNPKPSLETRLTDAESNLASAKTSLAAMTSERDVLNTRVSELETQLSESNQRGMSATEAQTEAQNKLAASETFLGVLKTFLTNTLGILFENGAEIDEAKLKEAVNKLAEKKAIDIAAGQGVPPVRTNSQTAGRSEEDEVKLAFENAAAETNPLKRGQLFAKASAMLNKKPSGLN